MPSENISPERRTLLKSLGVAGVGAGTGAGAIRTGVDPASAAPAPMETTWTKDRISSETGEIYTSSEFARYASPPDESVPRNGEVIGTYDATAIHSLSYVNACWEPLGNPAGDGGCWRHTFALSSLAIEQTEDRRTDWGISRDDFCGLQENAVSVHVPDGPDSENVAVAARRDDSLFTFVDPDGLAQRLEDGEELDSEDLDDLMQELRNREELDQPSVREILKAAAEEMQEIPGMQAEGLVLEVALRTSAKDALGISLSGLGLADIPAAGAASTWGKWILKAHTIVTGAKAILDAEAPPRFDRGVSQTAPDFDTDVGAGGHYLLFDVYTAPGQEATVEVSSDYFGGISAGPLAKSWELSFPAGPSGPDAVDQPADRFVAEATLDDSIESREI